jgi:hypothetical protein
LKIKKCSLFRLYSEKKRFRDFLIYLQKYDKSDPKTTKGFIVFVVFFFIVALTNFQSSLVCVGFDWDVEPMSALFKNYKLDQHVQDFVGHALALFQVCFCIVIVLMKKSLKTCLLG